MNQILLSSNHVSVWTFDDYISLEEFGLFSYTVKQLDPFSGEGSTCFCIEYLI